MLSVQRVMLLVCVERSLLLVGAPPFDSVVIQHAVAFRLKRELSFGYLIGVWSVGT